MMRLAILLALAASAGPATAADCYDLKVRATPIEQIPSDLPDCADCMVMRWPWFLDLRISRVLQGDKQPGTLRVLSVQHTWFKRRSGTWLLRRNTLGGYNVTEPDDGTPLKRCTAGTPPARAPITPGRGRTLDDLRAEGLARYGPAPR